MAALQPDHRTFGAFQDLPFYPLQSRAPGPWLSTAIEFLELLYDQHGPGSPYLVQDLHRFSEIDRSYRLSAEKRGIEQWLPLLRMWRDEFTAGQMITPSMSGKLWQQIGVTASGKGHKDLCLPEYHRDSKWATVFWRFIRFVDADIETREGTGGYCHVSIAHGFSEEYWPGRREIALRFGRSFFESGSDWYCSREVSYWERSRLIVLAHTYMRDRFAAREELHCYLAAAQLIARHISSPREVQILSLMERQLLDYAGSTQYGLIAFEGQREFLASVGFINNDQGRGKFAVVDYLRLYDTGEKALSQINMHRPSSHARMSHKEWKAMLPFQRAESLFYARPAPIWQAEIIAIRDIHDVLRRHAFSAADWDHIYGLVDHPADLEKYCQQLSYTLRSHPMDHITSHFQHHRMEDYKNQENLIGHLHHLASAVQATEIALRLNPPKSTSHSIAHLIPRRRDLSGAWTRA